MKNPFEMPPVAKPNRDEEAEKFATDQQIEMSKNREAMMVRLESIGKKGWIKREGYQLEGEINGHKIKCGSDSKRGTIRGEIDGLPMDESDASEVYRKYAPLAMSGGDERFLMEQNERVLSESNRLHEEEMARKAEKERVERLIAEVKEKKKQSSEIIHRDIL